MNDPRFQENYFQAFRVSKHGIILVGSSFMYSFLRVPSNPQYEFLPNKKVPGQNGNFCLLGAISDYANKVWATLYQNLDILKKQTDQGMFVQNFKTIAPEKTSAESLILKSNENALSYYIFFLPVIIRNSLEIG